MKKILITGVCGFIFRHCLLKMMNMYKDIQFIGIDNCDEPINIKNIVSAKNYKFYLADIRNEKVINNIFEIEKPDIIIHGAARSFVCSSIENPLPFIETNAVGTQILVNASIKNEIKRFIYISTDEIYGSLGINEKSWDENSLILPSSPYSASKLSGEHIVRAAHRTYGLNYNITRSCNVFGENQNIRNLIPKVITSLINNKIIPLHNKGEPVREWIYVQDKINAIIKILENGKINETYNIGSGVEYKNIEIVDMISNILNISPQLNLNENRLGQDFRYSVDCEKLKELGWKTEYSFQDGINKTVEWYINI